MNNQASIKKVSEETMAANFMAWASERGLTARELAHDTGYSENHCYMLLRGDTKFSSMALGNIVWAYGAATAHRILGETAVS